MSDEKRVTICENVYTLGDYAASLSWPSTITGVELGEVEEWIAISLRTMRKMANRNDADSKLSQTPPTALSSPEGVQVSIQSEPGETSPKSVTQPSSTDAAEQWFWYASGDEENYNVGPCASREEVIEVALQDETGISPDLKRQCFVVIRATQKPLKLSRMIDVDTMLDQHMDGMFYDAAGPEHDPAELIDHIKQEQWNELEQRLRATADAWQAERSIVVTPRVFNESTNPESLQYLYIDENHVPALEWAKVPDEFVHENVFEADGDTYICVGGQWYGPTPEGVTFGEPPTDHLRTTDQSSVTVMNEQTPPPEEVTGERGEAEIPEGFTKWEGGECPVPEGETFQVIQRSGLLCRHHSNEATRAQAYWVHLNDSHDIVAYRVITQSVADNETQGEGGDDRTEPTNKSPQLVEAGS